jgi:cysteine-rich repeat protein
LSIAAKTGDTSTAATLDWSEFAINAALPDGAAGDDLHVFHYRFDTVLDSAAQRKYPSRHLLDWFQATDATLQDRVARTISGAFQPTTPDKMVSFSVDRDLFDAGRGGTTSSDLVIEITANPRGHEGFNAAMLASFILDDRSHSASPIQTVTNRSYADPFPESWKRTVSVSTFPLRALRYPDPSSTGFLDTARLTGFNEVVSPYTGTVDAVPVPLPTNVKIGGVDFLEGGAIAFDGQRPVTVTWDAVPSARTYRLDIRRLNRPGAGSRTTSIATIRTAGTSLEIPAALLSDGPFFAFILNATRSPFDYGTGDISATGTPRANSAVASGRFRLSASCGDATVQAAEDCDDGRETATCNIDCTVPFCGDGLRNAAAGEACDTVEDALGCDSDCSLAVCGDGHPNQVVEDCDDGNTTDDGDGCGANCKFNNTCGNNIPELAAEQCDPGLADSAVCDSDCTLPSCGDGHVNTAAGEDCDDGNADDTDRCSAACKIQ